jgi:hypothetical protein
MFINYNRHDPCDLMVTRAEQEPSPISTRWRLLPGLEGSSRLAYPGTEQDQSFPEESSLLDTVASELQTVYTRSIVVVASINIINALHRLFVRPQEGAEFAQQAAYQPSGNVTSGQAS